MAYATAILQLYAFAVERKTEGEVKTTLVTRAASSDRFEYNRKFVWIDVCGAYYSEKYFVTLICIYIEKFSPDTYVVRQVFQDFIVHFLLNIFIAF